LAYVEITFKFREDRSPVALIVIQPSASKHMRFPSPFNSALNPLQQRQVAIVLAFAGVVLPVAGLHKFYLGQHRWGLVYLLLSWTPIPHVAAAIEAVWYLVQPDVVAAELSLTNSDSVATLSPATPIVQLTEGIRQLEQLRVDGLITEYEFEQKRRQFLDRL
jgi:TM2 domain-containing membrane protein YozV